MRFNVVLDEEILREARKYSSARTQRGLLEEALRTFVETKAAERRTENYRSRVRALDRKAAGLVLRESPHRILRSDRARA